jgi:membrane-bound inhibitor of C-type lysozyme
MSKIKPIHAKRKLKTIFGQVCLLAGTSLWAHPLFATDLLIHQPANATFSRKSVQYSCDASGAKIGVPSGSFPVEYINGGGNSLVVVPIGGHSLIFSNVFSGSGARYVAQQYTWWEAGGGVTLYSDSLAGKMQSTCKRVNVE